MVNADGRTALILAREISGSDGIGRPAGISRKSEPMVSTGILSTTTPLELISTAIRNAGRFGANLRSRMMTDREPAPTPRVPQLLPAIAPQSACHLGTNSDGNPAIGL